jgi:hypothetical protein
LSPVVELLPGVFVNRATEGQVWLGVPFGTDGFVAAELERQMVEHDQRQRGIATYASCNGDSVSHAGPQSRYANGLQINTPRTSPI